MYIRMYAQDVYATADVKAVASKAAGLGSARGILNPGYDYYHQPGKSLVPRYVLHYNGAKLWFIG